MPQLSASSPGAPDTDSKTADVCVDELRLKIGARLAYVFDYGDDWRVLLTLRERVAGSARNPASQRSTGNRTASVPAAR